MKEFAERYGRPPVVITTAPGRVNLIGEHTDYNDGFVLPLAIPQSVRVAAAPRDDGRVFATSAELGDGGPAEGFALGQETRGRGWLDHVQGVTAALAAAGHAVVGCDLTIRSTVPIGAGLASSAALAVALLRAQDALAGRVLGPIVLAGLARASERAFVGADVGIMDPMASLLAHTDRALLLDARTLATREVALPEAGEIVVLDSGVRHRHADGDYNLRREECRTACRLLDVASLRDLTGPAAPWIARLPPPLDRRVRHVLSENERVHAAVAAMEADDLVSLGALLDASHRSLRDDYEVSIPEIDELVARARGEADVFGARLTGGGFGGSIIALARRGEGRRAGERVVAHYCATTGREGRLLLPAPA